MKTEISPIGLTFLIVAICVFSYLMFKVTDSYIVSPISGVIIGLMAFRPTKCNPLHGWQRYKKEK